MTPRLGDVLDGHVEQLRTAGVPTPEVDVRLLAAHVLGADPRRTPCPDADAGSLAGLAALVSQRAERIPLQHLIGTTWFRHVQLVCRPGVFIPRPETEIVAGIAIDVVNATPDPLVLEPCTGSGAIAASLVAEASGVTLYASDSSPDAVALARENLTRVAAGRAGHPPRPDATWSVQQGDLFASFDRGLLGHADVLVANPPYMPARDRSGWEPEVALHDPPTATVGGDEGHEIVRRLLDEARQWLRVGGTLVIEIDERRGAETASFARDLGYRDVHVAKDLTGADRAVVGSWRSGADEDGQRR